MQGALNLCFKSHVHSHINFYRRLHAIRRQVCTPDLMGWSNEWPNYIHRNTWIQTPWWWRRFEPCSGLFCPAGATVPTT